MNYSLSFLGDLGLEALGYSKKKKKKRKKKKNELHLGIVMYHKMKEKNTFNPPKKEEEELHLRIIMYHKHTHKH